MNALRANRSAQKYRDLKRRQGIKNDLAATHEAIVVLTNYLMITNFSGAACTCAARNQQLSNLQARRQALISAILINQLIDDFPDCPRWASIAVDQLAEADRNFQAALRGEEF